MRYTFLLVSVLVAGFVQAQEFTLADTLRGTLSPLRSCYDVTYYDLQLDVNIDNKSISGVNHIHFQNKADFITFQFDLFENMVIDSIVFEKV